MNIDSHLVESKCFSEFENKQFEIEEITKMLWYIIDDYYINQINKEIYNKAINFDRLQTYLTNIYTLLDTTQKEMKQYIEKVLLERENNVNAQI